MIKIQDVTITKTGNDFYLAIVSDNLSDNAQFLYQVSNEDNEIIQNGELQMTGEEYTNWNGSNAGAYDWALNKLGFIRQG
jgi:hypothetical protein